MLELFPQVRAFVFEVDGVLTDGYLLLGLESGCLRSFSAKDLYALQKAVRRGYSVRVVAPEIRVAGLSPLLDEGGIPLISRAGLASVMDVPTLYMASELTAPEIMGNCFFPCCPANAAAEVKALAKYISPNPGGTGCVRDVVEKVLRLNGDW
jgi:3-deoxy-D-manno-octulosonate 8-phosphate phosphatase (KDO 8-P phosphatase)